MTFAPASPRRYLLVALAWFVAALSVGASGILTRTGPTVPQLLLALLTVALVAAAALAPHFRAWLAVVDLRWAIAIHLSRFVGIYFLMLYSRGLLPFDFAFLGGWGDIAVAVAAVALIAFQARPETHGAALWIWNVFGLTDIVFVVLTAARIARADPAAMGPLRYLPLSMLPTFFVPLIIASHLLIFWRLTRLRRAEA